jgi:elongation factor Ts
VVLHKSLLPDNCLSYLLFALSGAPMMDCKKALSDATVCGDIEKGMNWLRMKGIARASQSERASQEGLIAFLHTPTVCTLVEVNSETDFVGKNVKFHSFVSMLANVCNKLPTEGAIDIKELLTKSISVDKDSASTETIADSLGDIVSQIRENIVIRRAINLPTVQATEHSSQSIIAG